MSYKALDWLELIQNCLHTFNSRGSVYVQNYHFDAIKLRLCNHRMDNFSHTTDIGDHFLCTDSQIHKHTLTLPQTPFEARRNECENWLNSSFQFVFCILCICMYIYFDNKSSCFMLYPCSIMSFRVKRFGKQKANENPVIRQ